MILDGRFTWNGEAIRSGESYRGFAATLENYDPTPMDYETPATGPRSICGSGDTEADAITDLIERLIEL